MKTLSSKEMLVVSCGVNACDAALGLVVGIWGLGFGIINPFLGAAIGYLGGLAVGDICH